MSVLYHASTHKNLTAIEPRRTLSHGRYIGDFVFATHSKAYAAMYLAPRGRRSLLTVFADRSHLVVDDSPDNFIKDDTGGAIYTVADDSFETTPQPELSDTEVVSRVTVIPLSKEIFTTSLQALQTAHVPVFFVDHILFDKIEQADDHGWTILQRLQAYPISSKF